MGVRTLIYIHEQESNTQDDIMKQQIMNSTDENLRDQGFPWDSIQVSE